MKDRWFSRQQEQQNILGFALKSMGEFLLCILVLCFVGAMLSWKMDAMLNQSMEKAAAMHASSVAHAAAEQFRLELDSLEDAADLLGMEAMPVDRLLQIQDKKTGQPAVGLMDLDGKTIAGREFPEDGYTRLAAVFRGERRIMSEADGMLLFAVPVYHGDRVKYVLYRYEAAADLSEKLGSEGVQAAERILICEKDTGHLLVPYQGFQTSDEVFNIQKEIPRGFNAIRQALDKKNSTAVYLEKAQKRYFLFGADIYGTDFIVLGYMPWESMAADIAHIHMLAVWVFGLLLLLFAIFSLYSFMAKLKAKESDELREAKAAADQANRAKSDFLANMSHEIRTPINSVLGMNEMILRESREAGIRKYAWNIKSASETLLSLINDILDFSKIESGKMEIVPGEYQLSSVLNDVVNMIKVKAEQKKLQFQIQVDEHLPDHLFGDEVRIKQIVVNILNNAVKYTRKGQVCFVVSGEQRSRELLELQFAVQDTGIGIRPEDREKLFSHFERLDLQKNRHIEGTGLGLAITLNLVKQMQGTIQVESVYGQGSTFKITLTQKIMRAEKIGNFEDRVAEFIQHQQNYQQSFIAPDADILVVDDNEMNLFVVESLLKETKIKITRSASGRDCLQKMREKHYDIIFLDHMMPDMDGIETFQKAKTMSGNLCLDTPVIALTANAIAGVREMFLREGFTDYLSKPINSKLLERMLQKYLPGQKVLPVEKEKEEESHLQEVILAENHLRGAAEPLAVSSAADLPEWLLSSADVHVDEGVQHCGSTESYLEALKIFYTALAEGAAEIERYFSQEDWQNYIVKVHALKSTAGIIGAQALSEQARHLEMLGKQGDFAAVKRLTPALLDLYRSYQKKLAPLQQDEQEKKEKPLLPPEETAEAYATLKELSHSFDFDSIMFVLQSLEAYQFSQADVMRMKQIKAAAVKPDWDKLNELLK